MIYVALLRGINVGGKAKVEMVKLKRTFERLGFEDVKTYIASGNVIFRTDSGDRMTLTKRIEAAIKKDFGMHVNVLLRDIREMKKIVKALPSSWVNGGDMKCDVMFLWKDVDRVTTFKQLPFNKEIEDAKYVPGAIVWRIDREKISKTRLIRALMGTELYRQMTIRNCNTARKLYELMMDAEKGE
ncbi:MAG: DUF1697 domain-containing protein [Candidatus Uhrbacteria bacterium]|nr:DUF1697 domain-containing protein [Candidatus Uhrbacteria bacterium]